MLWQFNKIQSDICYNERAWFQRYSALTIMVPKGTNEIMYDAERTPPVIMQNPVWIQMVRFRYPDGMAVESMYYYSTNETHSPSRAQ